MSWQEVKKYLMDIRKKCTDSFNEKDKQTLFYFKQMIELMYSELVNETSSGKQLYSTTKSVFERNIFIIFENMQQYINRVFNDSCKSFDEIIKVSISSRYVDINGLNGLYNNFKNEVIKNMDLNSKVETLVNANTDIYKSELYSKCLFFSKDKALSIIDRYNIIFKEEFVKNIHSKRDLLLSCYKDFIDTILNESYEQKEILDKKNCSLIENTAHTYLKDMEYINIDKYTSLSEKLINNTFNNLEKRLYDELGIKRTNSDNLHPVRDYLLSFNNTICVKTKNIFDEMNKVITLDKDTVKDKLSEFNDLVTHIYEMKLVFDKKFAFYKKEFNVSRDSDKFNSVVDKELKKLTEEIKANISSIFRENVKIYNEVLYKTLLLKSKVSQYNTILSHDKVKDLLFK